MRNRVRMSQMKQLALGVLTVVVCLSLAPTWPPLQQKAHANSKVKRATKYYLKGMSQYRSRRYGGAISSFQRAARLLPRHPHFNCHRTKFYTYIGRAYERKRSPRSAMRAYTRAKRAGCRRRSERSHAIRRYRSLYRRWMTSIRLTTKPKKGRIYLVTKRRDKYIGKAPLKRVFKPGTYKFKIRLFDHQTKFFKVKLRPGRHIRKHITLKKGDDPIVRKEKPGIAPPPSMANLISKKKTKKKKKKKKKKEKDPIILLDDK